MSLELLSSETLLHASKAIKFHTKKILFILQECTFRKVWEDDGNRQSVEVEQASQVFFKTIRTRMNVVQVQIVSAGFPKDCSCEIQAHHHQA